jgi:hypothetical protein
MSKISEVPDEHFELEDEHIAQNRQRSSVVFCASGRVEVIPNISSIPVPSHSSILMTRLLVFVESTADKTDKMPAAPQPGWLSYTGSLHAVERSEASLTTSIISKKWLEIPRLRSE